MKAKLESNNSFENKQCQEMLKNEISSGVAPNGNWFSKAHPHVPGILSIFNQCSATPKGDIWNRLTQLEKGLKDSRYSHNKHGIIQFPQAWKFGDLG